MCTGFALEYLLLRVGQHFHRDVSSCDSGLLVQQVSQLVQRQLGADCLRVQARICHPSQSLFVRTLISYTDQTAGGHSVVLIHVL